jgi:hypothetical protein
LDSLALEARQPLGVGYEHLRQDLERGVTIESSVASAPHLAL